MSPVGQAAQGRGAPGEMGGWCHHLGDVASSAPPDQRRYIWLSYYSVALSAHLPIAIEDIVLLMITNAGSSLAKV